MRSSAYENGSESSASRRVAEGLSDCGDRIRSEQLVLSTVLGGKVFHCLSTIRKNNDNNNPDGPEQHSLRRVRWLLVRFPLSPRLSSVLLQYNRCKDCFILRNPVESQ